jgi:hypothetical protein
LAAALTVLGWDFARITEEEGFAFAALGRIWHEVHSTSLQLSQAGVQRYIASWVWEDVIQRFLELPAAPILALIGVALLFVFRAREKETT